MSKKAKNILVSLNLRVLVDSGVLHVVGKKGKCIALVYETGRTVVMNNFKEGAGLAYAPKFKEYELDSIDG